jgi:hypothetical protein
LEGDILIERMSMSNEEGAADAADAEGFIFFLTIFILLFI